MAGLAGLGLARLRSRAVALLAGNLLLDLEGFLDPLRNLFEGKPEADLQVGPLDTGRSPPSPATTTGEPAAEDILEAER